MSDGSTELIVPLRFSADARTSVFFLLASTFAVGLAVLWLIAELVLVVVFVVEVFAAGAAAPRARPATFLELTRSCATLHSAAMLRPAIASAIASVRRAMSACNSSTMRPLS